MALVEIERCILSEKGRQLYIVNGFKFGFHKRLAGGVERWVCTRKECKSFFKLLNGVISGSKVEHCHEKDSELSLERQRISNAVKKRAVQNICEKSKILIKEALGGLENRLTVKDWARIRQNIYNARSSTRNSTNVAELVEPEIKIEEETELNCTYSENYSFHSEFYEPHILIDPTTIKSEEGVYNYYQLGINPLTDMTLQAIKYEEGNLEVLDQLLLPLKTEYIKIKNVSDGWKVINCMQVRGAPAIAIVGCLSVALELYRDHFENKTVLCNQLKDKLNYLVSARPTAVNMANEAAKLHSLAKSFESDPELDVLSMKKILIGEIENMMALDIFTNQEIGRLGSEAIVASLIDERKISVLTHCNTGSLATAGYGTALGVIRSLHKLDKLETVYCTETRPYLQGARLTSYELLHERIPSTLICDNAVGALFSTKQIQAVLVGADRVASNGDTANKIGTYQIAVLAKYHNVDFYVCAPLSTCDLNAESGIRFTLEERPKKEMVEIMGHKIAPPDMHCWSPAFDVTPANLITGIITEKGVVKPEEIKYLKKQ